MTRACVPASVLLVALILPVAASARPPGRFTVDQVARMNRGEVVTRYWKLPSGDVGAGWAAGVVDAPPARVFAVIADVERYPRVFDRMAAARVTQRRPDGNYDFYYHIDMPWPLSDHWCVTRNKHEVDRERGRYRRSWTLVKGTFVHNRGAWTVRPFGKDGTRSLLHYTVVLKPRVTAPDFVLHHVSRVALPRSVEAVRRYVQAARRSGGS